MRSPVTLLFAFVLLGGGLWLVLLVTAEPDAPPSALSLPMADEEPDLVVPPSEPATVADSGAGLRFVVDVQARARVLPPPPADRFRVLRGGQEVELEVESLAGSGAGLTGVSRPGRALVRVRAGDRLLYRVVDVDQPEARTAVRLGTGAALSGRVVDRESRPIGGARIWYGEAAADGKLLTAESDVDGRFSLDGMAGGPGTPIVVSAPGLASNMRLLDPDGGELLFVMSPATRLRLQLVASAEHVDRARAVVVPQGAMTTEQLQYPFLMQSVVGWKALDDSGFCAWDDLPRGVRVGAVVHHPLAPASPPVSVELRGETERVHVQAEPGVPMRGRVVDGEERPVAGAMVLSHPAGREPAEPVASRWLLPPGALATGLTWCRTDAEGRYLVGRSQSGRGADAVAVSAVGRLGLAARIETGRWQSPLQEDFVLAEPPAGEIDPELRFHGEEGAETWVRVRPEPGFRPLPPDGALARPLSHPVLLRLRIAVERDGRLSDPVVLPSRVIVTPTDVQLGADGSAAWRSP